MAPYLAFLSGYFLGAFSFALLLARLKGVDIRGSGSGNPGATNAGRLMGRKIGTLVGFLDAAKGLIPVLAWLAINDDYSLAVWAGLGAFCGHIWPIYFRFQGGKGLATYVGAGLGLAPMSMLFAMLGFVAAVALARMMSVGSLAMGVLFPIIVWWRGESESLLYFSIVAGVLLFFTHRANIKRLLDGEERKLGSRSS
ncbi:MAG: glycerol-3-phosphate 1-O-acyltransferase PlsY [Planctomycetes bacterium]|nr:glycerol-3-phosphate 1-O-acyltransferase PlsY [Planctomycetota bacterium]